MHIHVTTRSLLAQAPRLSITRRSARAFLLATPVLAFPPSCGLVRLYSTAFPPSIPSAARIPANSALSGR